MTTLLAFLAGMVFGFAGIALCFGTSDSELPDTTTHHHNRNPTCRANPHCASTMSCSK